MRTFVVYLLFCLLVGCGQPDQVATTQPTLGLILSNPTATPVAISPSAAPASGAINPTQAVASTPSISADDWQSQYRAWIEEARQTHPYSESSEVMWNVMICESSGNPTIQGPGGLTGLFQYQPSTWAGTWNPYRDQPITDARAQIFATAKAWHDGNQQWWGVCL
ncbi:MAG TPA: hypothetical protein DEF47_08960 [Herpetosiphon sp.]|uniref:Transglycosylase SLT domain-containing protein n=1 Tax=Herpetosiphon aurantiacus (strain ATCC 23779 / DSM 785 / 114-95) TaxID=316274 RepID=A9AUM6_HERA2|nr:hypothetical protein [Herpetosiphon sp.]ABX04553.1 hypothetical protein Haur_1910 [Herpetosiphon aurantiacus DSM 785]HBW50024.1 hypothetical protein [Herpetosiphon sp.]